MRVFIAAPTQNRLAKRGTRLPNLADILSDRGCEVDYITGNFDHARKRHFSRSEVDAQKKVERFKLTVIRVLGYRRNISVMRLVSNFMMTIVYMAYLLKHMRRGDRLVVPPRPVEMMLMARVIKMFREIVVVVDVTDIWPDAFVFSSPLNKKAFTLYCSAMLYPSLKHLDRFVHNAPCFVSWIHRYAPAAESSFIPSGFDEDRWRNNAPRPRSEYRVDRLVCVAQLQLQCDVMPVIKALLDRPQFHLTIIGEDGNGERYPEVSEFVSANGMTNVEMLGRLSYRDVADRFADESIGIVPMVSSALPNKVFDCIGGYLPIIALGIGNDAARFVEEHGIGWSAAFDSDAVGFLLDSITPDSCYERVERLVQMRDGYSQRVVLGRYADIITR